MTNKKITIVDFGMGNLASVKNAFLHLQSEVEISSDPNDIIHANSLVIPGVGSFRSAMIQLQKKGLDEAIKEAALKRGINVLGICLGMQIMGSFGTEDGLTNGLGFIRNKVEPFDFNDEILKVPHVGFNEVENLSNCKLLNGLNYKSDFYFVHSFRMLPELLASNIAICNYGERFLASFSLGNIFGTQFHPEKSQSNGLKLLDNFLKSR